MSTQVQQLHSVCSSEGREKVQSHHPKVAQYVHLTGEEIKSQGCSVDCTLGERIFVEAAMPSALAVWQLPGAIVSPLHSAASFHVFCRGSLFPECLQPPCWTNVSKVNSERPECLSRHRGSGTVSSHLFTEPLPAASPARRSSLLQTVLQIESSELDLLVPAKQSHRGDQYRPCFFPFSPECHTKQACHSLMRL